jgi:hypothetical protein
LEAINRYCQPNKNDPDSRTSVGIAVCSRSSEYDELTDKLRLNGALMLQDLSECQVHSVMSQDHMKGVRDIAEHEPWITSMSRNPLLLNVMSVAYAGKSLAEKPTQTERQHHLMGEYVNLRLKESHDRREDEKAPDATQIRHLLTWLAKNMTESGQSVFHIESLQMTWLSKLWARCAYCLVSRIVFAAASLFVGTLFAFTVGFAVLLKIPSPNDVTACLMLSLFLAGVASLWFSVPGITASALEWATEMRNAAAVRVGWSAIIFSLGHGITVLAYAALLSGLLMMAAAKPIPIQPTAIF